jgi:hypothetical protein
MYCYRHLTKKRQKDEELMFDDVDERRKRRRKTKTKTKDENEDERRKRRRRRKRRSKKNRRKLKKKKNVFKTNVLVPKIAVVRKEEGATAAASHLPSLWRNSAGWSHKGRTGRDSPRR